MKFGRQHLDEQSAADFLDMKVTTLRDWRLKKVGPIYCKFGRAVKYPADSLETFVEQSKVRSAA